MATPRFMFVEFPARDSQAAARFYAKIFGWTLTDFGPTYACTMTGDVDIGLQADRSEATKAPLACIAVDDLEAYLTAVQSAGGAITRPIFGFPGGRRFHFRDLDGNELAVLQVG